MENGTRVSDITKKFERLNSKKVLHNSSEINQQNKIPTSYSNDDNELLQNQLGPSKNIIKRSNAFRTDKVIKTATNHNVGAHKKISSLQSSGGNATRNYFSSNSNYCDKKSDDIQHNKLKNQVKYQEIRSQHVYSYPNKKSFADKTKPTLPVSNLRNFKANVLNENYYSPVPSLPKKVSPQTSPGTSVSLPSDTLLKALSSPLPPGPPPKKPPRTFQYGFHTTESLSLSNTNYDGNINNKLILKPTLSNETNVPSRDNRKCLPFLQRSKTEPHINLNNQALSNIGRNQIPSVSIEAVKRQLAFKLNHRGQSNESDSTVCLSSMNSLSDKNGNVYDVPYVPTTRNTVFHNSFQPLKQISDIKHSQKIESVNSLSKYYEPYSPKPRPKLPSSHCNMNSPPKPNTSPSKDSLRSVHYLSSPVRNNLDTPDLSFSSGASDPCIESFKMTELMKETLGEIHAKSPTDSDTDSTSSFIDESTNSAFSAEQLTAQRKGYIQRVLSIRSPPSQLKVPNSNLLFEMLLLIGISSDSERGRVPFIKASYPKNGVSAPGWLEELCFPDTMFWPPQPYCHNNYRVVLTNSEGIRKYAYCRRLQPEETPFCLPLAYCLLTSHHDPQFYYKVLGEIESRHGQPETKFSQFVHCLFECNFPSPGGTLQNWRNQGDFNIVRAEDPRSEGMDLINLLNAISIPIFLNLFSTVLLERKVILIGSNVSRLSECIEGLETALSPFAWQHTLVTAVPVTMQDLCQAPTPYIVGMLRPNLDSFSFNNIDQVFAVDVDKSLVINRVGDEDSILPSRVLKCLRSALTLAVSAPSDNNVLASEAILTTFVQLIGHFTQHIITSFDSGLRTFQRENFVKSADSRSIQLFLEWFSETAMFTDFIDSRLVRSNNTGSFERRCAELIEQKARLGTKRGMKLNKTVKTLGDRFIDWASS